MKAMYHFSLKFYSNCGHYIKIPGREKYYEQQIIANLKRAAIKSGNILCLQ